MSPALKQTGTAGKLGSRVLDQKPIPQATRQQLDAVSQGWKSDAFRSSAEELAAASTRLQAEAKHESEFWQEVAQLKSKGWPVSRLPRDRKAIGVHFGFPEAAPKFRDRGFALLRQAADGSVILDPHSVPRKRDRLQVKIIRNGKRSGVSTFDPPQDADSGLCHLLNNCRNALFEEELFYEVSREARLIANQSISTRSQSVDIDVSSDYTISLLSVSGVDSTISDNMEDTRTAQFIAIALRLLLSAAHDRNLLRRSQKPPPMTLKPRPPPEYALLRPVLTHLRHRAEAAALRNDLEALLLPFQKADLPLGIATVADNSNVFESLRIEAPQVPLSSLMLPAKTGIKVTIDNNKVFELGLATFLGAPLLGTRYETSTFEHAFMTTPKTVFETRSAVMSFTRRLLLVDLVSRMDARAKQVTSKSDGGGNPTWVVTQPQSGLLMEYVAQEAVRRMEVSVQPTSISVRLSPVAGKASGSTTIWSWTASNCSKTSGGEVAESSKTFEQAVESMLGA
jgi:mediator of RNA polymerase II transcription subunit 17, fungi type